ncbi:MAG: DUF21 domain-containing protein [Phycisphaera sp.]|nr:DUF21 domain-containing protein [Phycisphaera sp.]
MSTLELVIWWSAAVLGMLGSAMFSGLETGAYTLNRVRLHVLAHDSRSGAALLERMILRPNRLLGTLLIGNNIANYVASLAIGALLIDAGYEGWKQVAINAAVLTPLLFVFGEVLPKDLFRSHADHLTVPFARPLRALQFVLTYTGMLPMIGLMSALLRRRLGSREVPMHMLHPRRVVTQLIREGVGHGVISPYQSNMIDRVLEMGHLKVRDVMVPWSEAAVLRTTQPPEAVWAMADRVTYARLPLVDPDGKVVGVIDVQELLQRDPDTCPPLTELAKPIPRIPGTVNLRSALGKLQEHRVSIGLVVSHDAPIGLVTTKELVEPIVGELDVW